MSQTFLQILSVSLPNMFLALLVYLIVSIHRKTVFENQKILKEIAQQIARSNNIMQSYGQMRNSEAPPDIWKKIDKK